ncbi:hypothetical protein CHPC1048_0030 [Streptococcus phage CHPC1048]|nr:hypothetical protein CHPC1048_0030 [Streptococcus phage CHPC1048]
MKKLFNLIWSNKQTETPKWTFEKNGSEPSRDRYNKAHGLGKTLKNGSEPSRDRYNKAHGLGKTLI